MTISFPGALDSFTNPTSTDTQDVIDHATQHENHNTAIEALEISVGITNSADTDSLRYMQERLTNKGDILIHNGAHYVRFPAGPDGYMIVSDSTNALGVKYIATSSGGTVTSVSVVSANGLGGTVATSTTTPAITITTSVNGIAKGNGTGFSTAIAGSDYYAPGSTDVSVADGGTGVSSLTEYAPIFGGTTGTGAVQSGTVGTIGQVLTSNGAGALPTMQNVGADFTYSGSLQIASATSDGTGVNASTHYQANGLTVGTCVLYRGTSGYAKLRYSPDNATWTDILSVSTAGGYTFPILMRKDYYYYVEVDSPIGGLASTASLTFMQ